MSFSSLRVVLIIFLVKFTRCSASGNSPVSFATISTTAGRPPTYTGDNGPATSAVFVSAASSLWVDQSGIVYFASAGLNRIRQVPSYGSGANIVSTFMGSGGAIPNPSPATLQNPASIWGDTLGNMFIADSDQSVISKTVLSSSLVSIFAGISGFTKYNNYDGNGGPATSATFYRFNHIWGNSMGSMYVTSKDSNIRIINPSGIIFAYMLSCTETNAYGDGGPATSGCVTSPTGVAQDTLGNMYIAQLYSRTIRQINSTGFINTYSTTDFINPWFFWSETHHCNCMYFSNAYNTFGKVVFGSPNVVVQVANTVFQDVGLASGDGGRATSAVLNPLGIYISSSSLISFLI
jgi:hypothetical protein